MFPNVFRRIALAQGLLPEAPPRKPDRKPLPPAPEDRETRDGIESPPDPADKD